MAPVSQPRDDSVLQALQFNDFAKHRNPCNQPGMTHDLWHSDGRNAMLVFDGSVLLQAEHLI